MQYTLNKFENDILETYELINGKVDISNSSELSKASAICNQVLLDVCQSIIFNGKYKGFRMMKALDDENIKYNYIAAPFYRDLKRMSEDDINDKNNYLLKNGIFFDTIDEKCNFFNRDIDESNNIFENEVNQIKDSLKQYDYYQRVFEENVIKKSLIMKERSDIKLSIFNGDGIAEIFEELINEQSFSNEEELSNYLSMNCGLEFINLKKQKNYTWFIYHNDSDIAGIGTLMKNPFINDIPYADKFKYLGFITVNYAFRGQKLGSLISESIMSYCNDNNLIYERSGSTNDGKAYIEKIIDETSRKYEDTLPIIKSNYGMEMKDFIHKLFVNETNYDFNRSILINKVKELQLIELEKGKLLKSDLKRVLKIPKGINLSI